MIYLILEAWWKPQEHRNDFGYDPVGYVADEEAAKDVVEKGGLLKGDETWSLKINNRRPPRFKYVAVKEFDFKKLEPK